jgi:hypothetical protein
MARGSRANYSPENLAKSMEWFHSILNGSAAVNGRTFGQCNMTFIYDTVLGLHEEEGDDPHVRVISRRHPSCEQNVAPIAPTIKDIMFL